jgi:2-methylisocitrate lyase-like PEP mutase family enzyme|tara:strand:+ start:1326 stop:2231 length:906 start_codon:yes stop_codon:yes gene_type:complete
MDSHATTKRKKYRQLLESNKILIGPGVYDGFSARLVEHLGFDSGFISGAGLSESALGISDVGIMGLEENLARSRAMVNCTSIPLQADADTGYGNAVNVHFTVKNFEQSGVSGIMIEDQVWPKRCGHMKGKNVISIQEATQKIRSAVEAREDPDFVIMSRTDSFATDGIEEVINRLKSFESVGADLLFADALLSLNDMETVVKNISKPLAINMGFGIRSRSTTPLISAQQLEDIGIAAVIYPRLLTGAALTGMKTALGILKESIETKSLIERPDLVSSFEEINSLTGIDMLNELEERYSHTS